MDPRALKALGHHLEKHPAPVVLVHGRSPEVDAMHETLGVPFERAHTLRATSRESMEVLLMTMAGLINTRLVAHLLRLGRRAVGLTGVDFGLMRSRFINQSQLGWVGGPPQVDPAPLRKLHREGTDVVLSPICPGPNGELLNVRADVVAQSVAVALDADVLEFVTDEDGIARHGNLDTGEVERLVGAGGVESGCVPKLQAALAAIDGGVPRVRIGTLPGLESGRATEVHT